MARCERARTEFARSDWLREEIHAARLPGGLRVFVLPKHGYRRCHAALGVRFGAADLAFRLPGERAPSAVPPGSAHFLEHALFAREDRRPACGGAELNGGTLDASTTFSFSCSDRFEENLEALFDLVAKPGLDEDRLAREREIIGQEVAMRGDEPDRRALRGLLEALYVAHPVRFDRLGTGDTVRAITRASLERCWRAFYRPENMVLFLTGGLDPGEALETAARAASAAGEPSGRSRVQRAVPDEPARPARPRSVARMDVSRGFLLVGWKDMEPVSGAALVAKAAETSILLELLFGRSSDLHEAAYAAGLATADFEASYTGERDFGYVAVGGETDEPERLAQAILAAVERARAEGFDDADFRRVQRKIIGRFLRCVNSLEFVADFFLETWFNGIGFFDYLPAVARASPEGVRARLDRLLRPELSALSIVEPGPVAVPDQNTTLSEMTSR
jgi:predicted Zn-dependent peptidase